MGLAEKKNLVFPFPDCNMLSKIKRAPQTLTE
jgi:hypothetical protein